PPMPHWPSALGRARADAGPLLLCAAVVAAISLLAGAVPGLLRDTADRAVQEAVRQSGDRADVTVSAHWEPDDGQGGRYRMPWLAEDLDALRERALDELGGELRPVLRPPVTTALSSPLNVTDGSVLRTFRLAYLSREGGPEVVWTAGAAPGPTVAGTRDDVLSAYFGPPWVVHAGVSETVAEALGVRPGDRLPLADANRNVKDVRISGVFRPVDRTDPAWRLAPWLLDPVPGADGVGSTRFGGLLSAESLPDARLALGPDQFPRAVVFTPDPDVLTWETAQRIAGTAVALKADSGATGAFDTSSVWNTQLDAVLREVAGQIDAASAQASVLLLAVLTAAGLVLLLAADLLVRRRAAALALALQQQLGNGAGPR
ncbi:ABC transporter permease, partial [Actinoplanes sp. NPDC024001]